MDRCAPDTGLHPKLQQDQGHHSCQDVRAGMRQRCCQLLQAPRAAPASTQALEVSDSSLLAAQICL